MNDNSPERLLKLCGIDLNEDTKKTVFKGTLSDLLQEVTTADGVTYGIFKEKNNLYHVKKQVNGKYEYLVNESVAPRYAFETLQAASKKLNYIIKEANTRLGIAEAIDLFSNKKKV
jgi:hypothetical protein